MCVAVFFTMLATAAADLELVKVMGLARHSVRTPAMLPGFQPSDYSVDGRYWYTNWERDWGANGSLYLTENGKKIAGRRGAWWAEMYKGIVQGCGGVTVYADGKDSTLRDVVTAEGFFEGFSPQCSQVIHSDANLTEWLFNSGVPINTSDVRCAGGGRAMVDGTTGGNPGRQVFERTLFLDMYSQAVDCCKPVMCNETSGTCTLKDIPTTWYEAYGVYQDGMATSTFLVDWVEMMYLNNMSWDQVARGLSADEMTEVTRELHTYWFDKMFINEGLAAAMGGQLLSHIRATLNQIVKGVDTPGLLSSPSDKMVLYFGHDSNISFLKKLLRLEYVPLGWGSSMIPPVAMLVFKVYEDPEGGANYVKLFYETQNPDQMRNIEVLSEENPADLTFLAIPLCVHGPENSCPFEDFIKILDGVVLEPCTKPF